MISAPGDIDRLARYRPDWRWILALSAVLMVLTSLPVAWGYLRQTPELAFVRITPPVPTDYTVYLAQIRQSAEGEWLLSDRFTTEPQPWGGLNTFWVAVGKLAGAVGASPALAFQLARLGSIPLALLAVDLLVVQALARRSDRRLAVGLIALAGGLGAYALPFLRAAAPLPRRFPVPLDIGGPLGVLNAAMTSGHVATALALLAATFAVWVVVLRTRRWRWAVVAGLLSAVHFSFHPFEVPLVSLVVIVSTALWALAHGRYVRLFSLAGVWAVVASPPVVYQVAALARDAVTAQRAAQNVLPGVPWSLTVVSLGVIGIAGAVGWWRMLRRWPWPDPAAALLVAWVPLQLALLHSPLPFQRRANLGLFLPLVLLGVGVLASAWRWVVTALRPRLAGAAPVVAGALAAVLLFSSPFFSLVLAVTLTHERWPVLYQPREVVAALAWVGQHTPATAVVLADRDVGNLLPAYAGRTTVVGHGVETVDFRQKAELAEAFFSNRLSPADRRTLFTQQRVTHVFVGPRERALGFTPGPELTRVYGNAAAVVYAVESVAGGGRE